MPTWKNQLYYGDNLNILRTHIPDESVDLIYLDPPFNSNATYNVLYKEKTGEESTAQVMAFEDTWQWGQEAEKTFHEIVTTAPTKLADVVQALRAFLGKNDLMAYLVMMSIRLAELRRVLKSTGSIYLHCDPTASHYLKILMDAIFSPKYYRNEIVWHYGQRESFHRGHFSKKHDIILFYTKSAHATFNKVAMRWEKEEFLAHRHDVLVNADGQEVIMADAGDGTRYERLVIDVVAEGKPLNSVWQIPILNSSAKERLGYPTQKPETLLERMIRASSNPGDIILDPFCGCGTAIGAAEALDRRWIGIDITHLAITLIKHRLTRDFDTHLSPYQVCGVPTDLPGAEALAQEDRRQFEIWSLGLAGARPFQEKRGADTGIDGYINFFDDHSGKAKRILVQAKSGQVTVSQIRDLRGVIEREKATIGVFLTLHPPTKSMRNEAGEAHFYIPEYYPDSKYPRLQILTIAALLDGQQIQYPRSTPDPFMRQATRRVKAGENMQEKLL